MEDVLVSICCITYNQESYIKQTIDGFLMQKTNFKFEIIIHDDASKDNTQKILKQYQEKYPNKIKLILQKENQYSQGKNVLENVFKEAKGKYIAICEGDDYWCNENKLQMQVDYLEKNNDCSFCFHNANIYDEQTKEYKKFIPIHENAKKIISKSKDNCFNLGQILNIGFIPTASFMFRTKDREDICLFLRGLSIGDLPLKLVATSKGYAYYIDEIMSVYRVNTGISAVDRMKKEDTEKKIKASEELMTIYDKINEMTNHKYDKNINIEKAIPYVSIVTYKNQEKNLFKKEGLKYYKLLPLKLKIYLFIKIKLKVIFNLIKKIKK